MNPVEVLLAAAALGIFVVAVVAGLAIRVYCDH